MKVAILGGTGVFGARLAELLVRDGHEVTVAGRDADKACTLAARIGATPLAGDLLADPAPLFAGDPAAVIDAAGPFQAYGDDPYRVARACIANGADYLDLSDDAGFTQGIAALDGAARAAGRRVLSGASSVPGLSSAAVAELVRGLDEVLLIDTAILPGNRAPRGLSVMASILSQAGRPSRAWRGGAWRPARGWTDRRRYALGPGDTRPGWFLDVPDIRLFPGHFGARSVTFRAGLELGILNAALSALAAARRLGPLPMTPGLLRLAQRVAALLEPLGTDRGAMLVNVVGTKDGEAVERRWRLVAEADEGPFVPCVTARALLRRLDRVPPGARPCLAELPLAEAEAAMADLAVRTDTSESPRPTLFRRALVAQWAALPPEIRRLHAVQDVESFSGTATVERGAAPLARLAAWLFGFPPAGRDVPVTVTKTRTERGETWQRDFGGRVFRSACTPAAAPGRVCEAFGPWRFELDVPVEDGAMRLPVRSGRFLGMPVPRALLPTSDAREYVQDGVFRFDVALGAPLGAGPIVRYRGTLTPDAARPRQNAPQSPGRAALRTEGRGQGDVAAGNGSSASAMVLRTTGREKSLQEDAMPLDQPKTATLYRMVMPDHLCPYGLKSKDLLEREGYAVDDHHLTTREETDAFQREHGVETTPQTFIGGERVGGYDDLRVHFGKEKPEAERSDTSYQPVIAVFSVAFLMAIAAGFAGDMTVARTVQWCIAFSMCILAILKLQDVESFSTMFLNYDLLARRWVRYGYLYPFGEALAGILMIAGVLLWIAVPVALFIGTVGAVSVVKAVYIDKRELKCACVGGGSNVPLGFISLTENVMMVVMAIWMILA